jgi:putative glutamine amidotransferase
MQKKPIIGIVVDLVNNSKKYHYSSFPWYALRQNYSDSVIKAGGVPLMIPYQHDTIEEILSIIDGLIIPGGDEDINPKIYGQEYDGISSNDQRDDFELVITKKALVKHIPFLGICRGMQLLNVASGGDLIQHIPDYIKIKNKDLAIITHEQPCPKHTLSHLISITPNTILANIAGGDSNYNYMVNSSHHQAVGKLGNDLVISAIAPDGIIEAIESTNYPFVMGIEWHPEYLNSNNLDLNIFKALIQASQASSKKILF